MRMRCTVVFEYEADPANYVPGGGDETPADEKMICELDTAQFKDDPFVMAETIEGASKYTVKVEKVEEE
jgi:hypothetical protein